MKLISALLEISAYSAVLYAAVMLIKLLFKKRLSPMLHFALWFLVIARLCVPVTLESCFHFFTVSESAAEPSAVLDTPIQEAVPYEGGAAPAVITDAPPQSTAVLPGVGTTTVPMENAAAVSFTWADALIVAWAAGIAFFAIRLLLDGRKLRRMITKSGQKPDARVLCIYEECKRELGIKAKLPLCVLPGVSSPALTLSLRPAVILPRSVCESHSNEQLSFMLRHELTHYKRGDHILSMLLRLLECVYWFNPVVWLMNRALLRDMETACDSRVTAEFSGEKRREYALTLLALFAQPSSGGYVLGMALNNTERDAERRARGVFATRRTKGAVKAACTVLALMLLVCCFTTACQPTPETEIVINKGDDGLDSVMTVTPDTESPEVYAPYEAPAEYQNESTHYNGKVQISFDADVAAPSGPFPVYVLEDAPFTRTEVDNMINVFMQGKPITAVDDRWTKQEIMERALLPAMQTLEELKNGTYVPPDHMDSEPPTVEEQEAHVAYLQELYNNAPEQRETNPTTTELYRENELFRANAELGYGGMAEIQVNGGYMMFHRGSLYYLVGDHGAIAVDEQPAGLSTTQDEAVVQADALVRALNAEGMSLSAVGVGIRGDGSEFDIASDEYQSTRCWVMIYQREVNGIPSTYEWAVSMSPNMGANLGGTPAYSNKQYFYERIYIAIDDRGICNVEWYGRKRIKETLANSAVLLPFDDVAIRLGDALAQKSAWVEDNADSGGGLSPIEYALNISRVTLGYSTVFRPDTDDYLMLPVWDCFGGSYYIYDEEQVAAFNKENGTDIQFDIPDDGHALRMRNSYLTINAIDGSVIDRNQGY